ncbi:MTRF1L release factor glutamine methyltransferase isoform X3 [Parus major]|uniref:MTRF1L release factor glutamine methyltransferase isoform X3 n=1 Tax=Parus major TaxID=9157 RepID=UPI0007716585|nr:MTRF1L release factor glutamine methyltransferase isoform X3 [Parus major]
MRCLTHPLLRKLLSLPPQHVPGRGTPSKGAVLSPKQLFLRQSCGAEPGLMTATDMVNYWQKVFETNGIPEARESSQYIVSFVLGAKTFQSLDSKSLHTPLTALQQEQIQQLSHKRLQRMPVQYVLGEWDFQDLTLKMRPPVFIPRPETESRVIAMDKEEAAVDLTRENALRLQLQERIHIIHQDVSHSSAKQLLLWGPIDVIVSNPPYVFHEDMASLDAEILCYEDLDALDGGDDGMRVIKTILSLAPSLLKVSGEVRIFEGQSSNKKKMEESSQERECRKQGSFLRSVFLEVDPRHPNMVEHWLQAHPELLLTLHAIHKDFCGKPRFLHIQKQSS